MGGETTPEVALAIADPKLAALVGRFGRLPESKRRRGQADNRFAALIRGITGQKISTGSAAATYARLLALFGGRPPSPPELLAAPAAELRAIGLSDRKVSYLHDLAGRVASGELDLDSLDELEDAEVVRRLTAVRGLGPWTAEVFMLFSLGRPDVLPVGDQGIRRAVKDLYGLAELPDEAELRRIAEPWRPHRSLACLLLWETLAAPPV